MTPDEYRTRWDLPSTYPMVAPNYANQRSALARSVGLGRKPGLPTSEPAIVEPDEVPIQNVPAGRRGRKPGRPKRDVQNAAATDEPA